VRITHSRAVAYFPCKGTENIHPLATMPNVPLLKSEDAPPVVKAVYEEFYRRMSFPAAPNFIMTQGHSPTAVRGTWEVVQNVLVNGIIPRWTKEMLFVAISKERGCQYCTAAHVACCRMLGVKPHVLYLLVEDVTQLSDTRLRDTILFGMKCARDPQSVKEEDYAKLRKHGLKQSEIVELIAMSAFAVYANIIADATAMEPDEMFATI
jgi:uncharacterized peroxidase-related enzyme